MCKRRTYSIENPKIIKFSKRWQQENTAQSVNKQKKSLYQSSDLRKSITSDNQLSAVFNKNISRYRDMINSNDHTILPFIASLRDNYLISDQNKKLKKTILLPFQVADKITCCQKIQKDLTDIKGRSKRLTNAYYRWHNKSGSGIKQSCFFQSKLRQTSNKFYKDNTFKNLYNPLQSPKIVSKLYNETQLICPRQKRLFTLQY